MNIQVKKLIHKDKVWYALSFDYNKEHIEKVKEVEGRKWSQTHNCWLVPYTDASLHAVSKIFPGYNPEKKKAEKIELSVLKGNRMKIIAPYNKELVRIIKEMPYHVWSKEHKWWTVPYADKILTTIEVFSKEQGWELKLTDRRQIKPEAKPAKNITYTRDCPVEYVEKLKELRYSENTKRTYLSMFREFINYHYAEKPEEITEKQIVEFMRYLVNERGVSTSYQNQSINAIKFYYEKVLRGRRKLYYVDRPMKEKPLPVVMNKQEVLQILDCTVNLKHKALLTIIYSCGLRLGESIRLKIKDIDFKTLQVHIRNAKGNKDRYVKMAERTKEILGKYIKEFNPEEYVFEGQTGGQYSARSVQNVFKHSRDLCGIRKDATVHTLRHSIATHMLEQGIGLRYIQAFLGHKSSKTTEIYTHITQKGVENIINPLDFPDE